MSEELEFRAYVRRNGIPGGEFTGRVLGKVAMHGLRYGGYHWDETVKEDPPTVYSSGGRPSWPSDFPSALRTSEAQGWARVGFEFDGPGSDPRGVLVSIRPYPDSRDSPWIQFEVFLKFGHVGSGEEMTSFLDSIIVPLFRDVGPTMAVGDVLEYNQYEPSVAELERGAPSELCWFNYYSAAVAETLGVGRLASLGKLPCVRYVRFGDGGTLVVLEPLPRPDIRSFAASMLDLSGSRDRR